MTRMQRVEIIAKRGDDKAEHMAGEIGAWLQARGVAVGSGEALLRPDSPVPMDGPRPDFVLVLGGDGTIISVSRQVNGARLPLLGLNLGRVGFLAQLTLGNWQEKLEEVLDKGLQIREQLALDWEVIRGDHRHIAGTAVNDLVINRGPMARLVNIKLCVGHELVGVVRADGLIISTPAGSTGYGVSARGPILHPGLDAYGITAICPFLNEFPPMVLPGNTDFELQILEGSAEVYATQDGQEGHGLAHGDVIKVRKAGQPVLMVETGTSYFSRLRDTGFVGGWDFADGGRCD